MGAMAKKLDFMANTVLVENHHRELKHELFLARFYFIGSILTLQKIVYWYVGIECGVSRNAMPSGYANGSVISITCAVRVV